MEPRRKLIVVGGGEHARVVAEVARSRPDRWDVVGFSDIQPCPETSVRLGLRQFETDEHALAQVDDSWFVLSDVGEDFVVGKQGSCLYTKFVDKRDPCCFVSSG